MGVSFVIPVRNGARWLDSVLAAVRAQTWSGSIEIIAVDDGSTDDSAAILARHQSLGRMKVINGHGRGAAAAINQGVRAAAYPLIAQVDQDVVLSPTWLARLVREFDDPQVAAAQGRYLPIPVPGVGQAADDIWSRVMALDLAFRYRGLASTTNHVCTGNSVYRRSALLDVGLFDEDLGYGYDNDLSYRLTGAGHRLAFCHDAESIHHWREGVAGYVRQQYGFGYGRLSLLARHPRRAAGDNVSRLPMMLHGPVTAAAVAAGTLALGAVAAGGSWIVPAGVALALILTLAVERFAAGVRAAVLFRDPAGLCFVPVHAVRNLSWVAAITMWIARTAFGVEPRPFHSMHPRPAFAKVTARLAEVPLARRGPGAPGA